MKRVSLKETKRFQNSKTCAAIEYPLGDKDINGATIELDGKYPENGFVVNTVCKELAYIIEGSGYVVTKKERLFVSTGDLVLIHPNDEYYWEGKMKMFVPSTPAWFPEQHKEVSE